MVFEESGVKKRICVLPLGVDYNLYSSCKKENGTIDNNDCFENLLGKPKEDGVNSFRFLSLFGWSYRKGTDILIKSFVQQFSKKDDVCLIIVARHAGSSARANINVIKAETERFAREVRSSDFPQIILYPHVTPEHQMPSLYKMGHVFVHLSRGEGFSLPQIEAAASGLPVISCNNTGMSEYLSDDNAFLIKTSEKEICSPEMHWISGFYHGQLFPKLGRDQINQFKRHMEFVINNYAESLKKTEIFKKDIVDKYTWDKAAERVANRIREIS